MVFVKAERKTSENSKADGSGTKKGNLFQVKQNTADYEKRQTDKAIIASIGIIMK